MTELSPLLAELEQRLQKQTGILEDAIAKTRNNEVVDISMMDDEVTAICNEIAALDMDDAQKLESAMVAMIGKLEELAIELKSYQERSDEAAGTT